MKLPRNAKIFRGQLDAAPFAGVFFLLLILLTLSSTLVFSPGVKINLPEVREPLGGAEGPTVVVAIDAAGLLYYDNQAMPEGELRKKLAAAVQSSRDPLTLEILADKAAKLEIAYRLMGLAGEAGFKVVHCVVRSQPLPSRAP
ncbi:MAG: biopolymer transporter ExbD [Verrucomicrobia bacterium]|nr:biopolymer transporter ExbD [Verrucomicrobiota bacterium]